MKRQRSSVRGSSCIHSCVHTFRPSPPPFPPRPHHRWPTPSPTPPHNQVALICHLCHPPPPPTPKSPLPRHAGLVRPLHKSWSIIGKGMFALREVNQMEQEMCSYLEWQLDIEPSTLKDKGFGPYPTYVLPSPAPSPMHSTTPYQPGASAPTPVFASNSQQAPSTSPPKPIPSPVHVHAGAPPSSGYLTQTSSPHTPGTPDTPESSMSTSTSPASSAPPSTPPGYEDHSVRVVGAGCAPMHVDNSASSSPSAVPHMSSSAAVIPPSVAAAAFMQARAAAALAPAVTKKAKSGDIFARANPCVW